ncbi:MAG: cyclase family protein [Bacteroidota bacterium]
MIDISTYMDDIATCWPGDIGFKIGKTMRKKLGNTVNLSSIHTSVHNGTHVDAPWHYDEAGPHIDEIKIYPYIGPCVVIYTPESRPIQPSVLDGVDLTLGDRVLFKTRLGAKPSTWETNNPYLDVNTVIALSHIECPLVGIDAASVDPTTSTSLEAHHAMGRHKVGILENLDLSQVVPGRYFIIALPLKLRGLDASPVRAVLLTREEGARMFS